MGPRPATGSSIQTAHQAQHTRWPHVAERVFWASQVFPCPAGSQAQSACPQSMQGLSNSLSTEYLRRKIPFFFPQEREREGGRRKPAKKEEEKREGETYPITAVKVTGIVVGRARARSL